MTSRTWVTSDLHFHHNNILKFQPNRKFNSVQEMNEAMIREWNEKVSPEDTVYILGDVAFCPAKEATAILTRLNGKKILIEGNHDSKLVKSDDFKSCFVEIHKYLRLVYDKTLFCMFHFPIHEWDQCHRGSIHLHGHVHGKKTGLEKYRVFDAGCDATGNVVTPIEWFIKEAEKRAIKTHGNGE